jgi:hypothetical protein
MDLLSVFRRGSVRRGDLRPNVTNINVGATIGRPQILHRQNLSPQGEKTVIFLRKIRKTKFFGG